MRSRNLSKQLARVIGYVAEQYGSASAAVAQAIANYDHAQLARAEADFKRMLRVSSVATGIIFSARADEATRQGASPFTACKELLQRLKSDEILRSLLLGEFQALSAATSADLQIPVLDEELEPKGYLHVARAAHTAGNAAMHRIQVERHGGSHNRTIAENPHFSIRREGLQWHDVPAAQKQLAAWTHEHAISVHDVAKVQQRQDHAVSLMASRAVEKIRAAKRFWLLDLACGSADFIEALVRELRRRLNADEPGSYDRAVQNNQLRLIGVDIEGASLANARRRLNLVQADHPSANAAVQLIEGNIFRFGTWMPQVTRALGGELKQLDAITAMGIEDYRGIVFSDAMMNITVQSLLGLLAPDGIFVSYVFAREAVRREAAALMEVALADEQAPDALDLAVRAIEDALPVPHLEAEGTRLNLAGWLLNQRSAVEMVGCYDGCNADQARRAGLKGWMLGKSQRIRLWWSGAWRATNRWRVKVHPVKDSDNNDLGVHCVELGAAA